MVPLSQGPDVTLTSRPRLLETPKFYGRYTYTVVKQCCLDLSWMTPPCLWVSGSPSVTVSLSLSLSLRFSVSVFLLPSPYLSLFQCLYLPPPSSLLRLSLSSFCLSANCLILSTKTTTTNTILFCTKRNLSTRRSRPSSD